MLFNIQMAGFDTQLIKHDGTMQELIDEIEKLEWFYCKNFEDALTVLHVMNGEFVTSITEIKEDVVPENTEAAS